MADRRRRERPTRERVAPTRTATRTAPRASRAVGTARRPGTGPSQTVAGTRLAHTPRRSKQQEQPKQPKRTPKAGPGRESVGFAGPANPPTRGSASPVSRRRRSRLATVACAVLVVGFVVAFVYPTRTYLRQRTELSAAETRLQILERETRVLEADSARLESDAEIERVAREQYGLIRPNETPFVLVPESTTPTTGVAPTTKPAG